MKIYKCYDRDILASLYLKFLQEVYTDRCIASLEDCLRVVNTWIDKKTDCYIVVKNDIPIGLFMGYVDTNGGTLRPAYRAEISYVLPEYRGYKASYIVLTLPIKLAEQYNLDVVSKSTVHNGVNKMHQKLGGELIFEERIRYGRH